MSCREEIALVDELMIERLEKLSRGETADAWKLFDDAFKYLAEVKSYLESEATLETKKSKYTQEDFDRAMMQISEIITYGVVRYSAFELVQPMLEQRRKLCETEGKILKENEHTYPVEKVFAIMVALGAVMKRFVVETSRPEELAKELIDIVVTKERKIETR